MDHRCPVTDIGMHPWDVSFPRMPVWWRSGAGNPYLRWVPCGMPKLGRYAGLLKTVVFLYPTTDDAIEGRQFGGSGFLISVQPENSDLPIQHIHCITNMHVAVYNPKGAPAPVTRVNRNSDPPDTIELDPSEWISWPA